MTVRAGCSDKYGQVYVERIGNTGFPDPDEPIALLRGQDKHAWAAMRFYKSLIDNDPGVSYEQRQSVARQCYRFQLFRDNNPDKMRTPGERP